MKLSDTERAFEKECTAKIRAIFSHDECIDMATTLLGASDLMAKFLTKDQNIEVFKRLPKSAQYGILQFVQWYQIFSGVIQGEIKSRGDVKMAYLPVCPEAWKTDKDFDKRILILVKAIYERLKEEGKISTESS